MWIKLTLLIICILLNNPWFLLESIYEYEVFILVHTNGWCFCYGCLCFYLFINLFIIYLYFCFCLFMHLFRFYLFLERGKGREKEEEKHQWVVSRKHLDRGPNPHPRHVAWLGIKQVNFRFHGWCPSNWATPVRADVHTFESHESLS